MTRARRISLVLFAVGLCALLASDRAIAASKKVDLNSATQQELETLPGVGEAIAKKIIAGRPYSSAADLSRAGVPDGTIQKITPLVKAGRASAKPEKPASGEKSAKPSASEAASSGKGKSASAGPASEAGSRTGSGAGASASSSSSSPVDLNSASAKELEALPGVGPATATKIIAGRPYAAVGDLSRAGVSASTIAKISPLVRVSAPESARGSAAPASAQAGSAARPAAARPASSAAPASSAPSAVSAPAPAAAAKAKPAPSADAGASPYQPPPSAGMVWVNLDSKVFHREGDRWYGKTKHGKYMSEADAVQAGYRASKQSPS